MAFFGFSASCYSNGGIYLSQCEAMCEDPNAFALFRCPSRRRGCGQFCKKATESIEGEGSSGKCSRLCRGRRNAVCGWNGTLYDNPCHAKCLGVATSFTCRQKGYIFNEKGCEENCVRNKRPDIAQGKNEQRVSQVVPAVIYEEMVEKEGSNEDNILSEEEYDTMKAEEEEMKRISTKLLNRKEILEFNREIFGKEEEIKPIVVTDQDIAESQRRETVKKIQSKGEERSESNIKRIHLKDKGEDDSNGIDTESEEDSNEIQNVNKNQETEEKDEGNEENEKSENSVVNKIVRNLKGREAEGSKVETSTISKGKFKKIINTAPQFENEFGDRDGFRIESRFEGQVIVEPEPVKQFDNLIPSIQIAKKKQTLKTEEEEDNANATQTDKPTNDSPKEITKEENETPKETANKTSSKDDNTSKIAEAKNKKISESASSENDNIPQQDTNSKAKSQKVDKIQKLQANKDKCLKKCASKNLTRLVCFSDGLVYIDLCTPICNGLKPRFLCSLNSTASTCGVQCIRKVKQSN